METENLLEIRHMRKAFDGLGVLKDISLTVKKGEVDHRTIGFGEVNTSAVRHLAGKDGWRKSFLFRTNGMPGGAGRGRRCGLCLQE